MAKTYATIEGCKQPKTCTGGNDGVRASAQSYDGSIIVCNRYNDEGQLEVRVGTNDHSSCYTDWNSTDFSGTFEDFKNLLRLAADIRSGKATVVRHKAGSKAYRRALEKTYKK